MDEQEKRKKGWYRDPTAREELRYWDGQKWSKETASFFEHSQEEKPSFDPKEVRKTKVSPEPRKARPVLKTSGSRSAVIRPKSLALVACSLAGVGVFLAMTSVLDNPEEKVEPFVQAPAIKMDATREYLIELREKQEEAARKKALARKKERQRKRAQEKAAEEWVATSTDVSPAYSVDSPDYVEEDYIVEEKQEPKKPPSGGVDPKALPAVKKEKKSPTN